jgi:general secretion pathway protein G
MTTSSLRRRPVSLRRAGFTIVELLMVILIIGILAALLFPAIQAAMLNARAAEVVVEIKGMEKGMVDFKARYGTDPPSFIVLCEAATDWNSDWGSSPPYPGLDERHRRASRALVRQIWPDFDFTTDQDIDGDGNANETFVLNGAECLVFFLGGVVDPVDTNGDGTPDALGVRGFSANPQYPFVRGGNRVGPFVNFDSARLIDVDTLRSTGRPGSGMPEFLDTIAGQELPYQYLSSYAGRGYQPYGLDFNPSMSTGAGTIDDELMVRMTPSVGFVGLASPYLRSASATSVEPWNRDTWQIISPGFDFEFGIGGFYGGENVPTSEDRNNNGVLDPPEDTNANGMLDSRTTERDNITNFKGGRLN